MFAKSKCDEPHDPQHRRADGYGAILQRMAAEPVSRGLYAVAQPAVSQHHQPHRAFARTHRRGGVLLQGLQPHPQPPARNQRKHSANYM